MRLKCEKQNKHFVHYYDHCVNEDSNYKEKISLTPQKIFLYDT